MTSESCVFCRITARELDASVVFESATVLAIMDVDPVTAGHVLVLPKSHLLALADLSVELAAEMFAVARSVAAALRSSTLRCEGVNLFYADGEAAFQEVLHSHLHVFPRFADDGFTIDARWGSNPQRSDLDAQAGAIRAEIGQIAELPQPDVGRSQDGVAGGVLWPIRSENQAARKVRRSASVNLARISTGVFRRDPELTAPATGDPRPAARPGRAGQRAVASGLDPWLSPPPGVKPQRCWRGAIPGSGSLWSALNALRAEPPRWPSTGSARSRAGTPGTASAKGWARPLAPGVRTRRSARPRLVQPRPG